MGDILPIRTDTDDALYFPPFNIGIAEFATLMSSDKEFAVFRCFNALTSRTLLTMQTRLIELGEELYETERLDYCTVSSDRSIDEHRRDDPERRQLVLNELPDLLEKYQKMLLRHKEMLQLSKPCAEVRNKIDCWYHQARRGEHVGGACVRERSMKDPYDYWRMVDYVTLSDKTQESRSLLESFTRSWLGWLLRDRPPVPSSWKIFYYCRDRVERVKDWLAFPLACIFLIAPALAFHFICNPSVRLGVMLGFVVGLSLVVQLVVGTTRQHTLAAALAYTGVISMLLQAEECPNVQ